MATVENKILAARTSLLWDHIFFGALAVQMVLVDATDDPRIDTMAVDGKHLFYHAPYVESLTKDELLFVKAHEVLHNALEHHIRRGNRDPKLWNKACDYVINGELVACKVGTMPKGGLLDARYTGMGAEEVYRILEDEGGGGGGDEGSDPGGCGGVLDGCNQNDAAAVAEARAEMQTKVRQAAAIAKGQAAGNLPAGVKRLINELTKPVVNWRDVLRRFIDESQHKDFSWTKPNRRLLPQGLIMPGLIADGINHFVIAVDTSGSIDEKALDAFGAEIRGAFEEGNVDKITVLYADTKVHNVQVFEQGDELRLEAKGGGGTAFSNTFEWIEENAGDASAVAYFTDLECYDFGEEPACPCLWACYGDSRSFEKLAARAPFGEAISLAVA
jgi:predicted metal-dependent peptidase